MNKGCDLSRRPYPHRATVIGDSEYIYDRNGNVTTKISSTMEKTESTETETYNGLGEKDTVDELQKVEPDDKTNNGQGNAFGLQDSKPGVD